MKAIINGRILLPDGEVSGKALLFDRAVTGLSDTVPAGCETIDAQGLYVSPGFVDVHIHGYLGEDASDGSLDGLRRMARGILQNGVTSFLPTTMTVAWEELTRAFETIRAFMDESARPDFDGARALGYRRLYLETHTNLIAACRMYEKLGFSVIDRPAGVQHGTMNRFYLKEL